MDTASPSLLSRIYLWQARRWASLIRIVDGAYTGLWLGFLSAEQLEAVDEAHYSGNATYNGQRHNLSGLMPWELNAIERFFTNRRRLALIGAGGGRELLSLEQRGYSVDGFECNATLVAFSSEFLPSHGASGKVRLLARGASPAAAGYEGLIMGWSAYALIRGRARRIELLSKLRPLIPDGAPLLLSFFTRTESALRLRTIYRVARAVRWLRRGSPVEFGDDLMPLFVHRFDRNEVDAELRSSGFRLAHFEPEGQGTRDSGWAVGFAESVRPILDSLDAGARHLPQGLTSER